MLQHIHQWIKSALLQIMACRLFGAKPLSKPMLGYWPLGTNMSEILTKIQNISFKKMHLKSSSVKWWPFCPGGDELRAYCHLDIESLSKPTLFHNWYEITELCAINMLSKPKRWYEITELCAINMLSKPKRFQWKNIIVQSHYITVWVNLNMLLRSPKQ